MKPEYPRKMSPEREAEARVIAAEPALADAIGLAITPAMANELLAELDYLRAEFIARAECLDDATAAYEEGRRDALEATTTPVKYEPCPENATKEDLLALAARMRRLATATYMHFFVAGMGAEAHAFLEINGVISKYVDLCFGAAAAGIDFRHLNTHSGQALPIAVHDASYLAEKLACMFGPSLRANEAARDAFLQVLLRDPL